MAYTLSNLLRDSLIEAGDMRISLATNGSTTTVADTSRDPTESQRQWENGTLIVLRDAAGAGAAPEGQFSRISAYANKTFSLASPLTADVENGDRYGVVPRTYTHEMLIELANQAMQQIGEIGFDDQSITTAANKREYTLPVVGKRAPVNVWMQTETGDSDDNQWKPVHEWQTDWASAGSTGLLILQRQPPTGRLLKLEYFDVHPVINDYDDVINEVIHPVLARKSMVERMANYLTAQAKQTDQPRRDAFNKAAEEFEQALADYPVRVPRRIPQRFITKGARQWPGDPDTVL